MRPRRETTRYQVQIDTDIIVLTPLRLQREKNDDDGKIGDYGIGQCWVAMESWCPNDDDKAKTRAGRAQHVPTGTAARSRFW